jgi:tetratricopeptide (TPR) repeat protein
MSAHDGKDPLLERLVLDQRPGPAPRISSARANALVEAAMSDALARGITDEVIESQRARRGGVWQAPWLRAVAMAAAGLLMLVGGAAAAKLVIDTIWAEPPSEPAKVEPPAPKQARRAVDPAQLPEDAVPPEPPELLELEESAPVPVKATARRDERELDKISEDLLQAANRARAAGQFRDAADTYAEVYERHPSSLSAYVAEVAAGSLELEHLDRPDRAVRLFRRALRTRPGGALDLEARQGLAIALRDLGRERDEIAALKALVAAHPERPAAERARVRLRELGAAAAP